MLIRLSVSALLTIFTTWTLWSSFQKRDSWSLHKSKKWNSSSRSIPDPDLTAPFSSKWFSSHCNLAVGFPTGGDDVLEFDSVLELLMNSRLCGILIWHVYPWDFSWVFDSIRCHSSSFELLILPTDSLSVCSLSPSKKSFSLLERGSDRGSDRGSNAIGFVLAGIIRKNPFSLPFSSNFYPWHKIALGFQTLLKHINTFCFLVNFNLGNSQRMIVPNSQSLQVYFCNILFYGIVIDPCHFSSIQLLAKSE